MDHYFLITEQCIHKIGDGTEFYAYASTYRWLQLHLDKHGLCPKSSVSYMRMFYLGGNSVERNGVYVGMNKHRMGLFSS